MTEHVHETAYETGEGPDYNGTVRITGHCVCGAITEVSVDSVL